MTSVDGALRRVSVGIGQLEVTRTSDDVLVAHGLGSCVGVSAHDPVTGATGLIHVLLPESPDGPPPESQPARFADTGIRALLAELEALGANRQRLVVKMAGGAAVLGQLRSERFHIGERNAEVVRNELRRAGLRCSAEDLGGTTGRTMEVHADRGRVFVRTALNGVHEL